MAYCKGQCCGKAKGCDCQEYGPMVPGCIREVKPGCPYKAVIPTLTVEDKSNLKDLADCFVHVSNINTTFYIDDKHRTIVTWAGPVEYDNYDLDTNTLGLRSQFLIDHANDYAAYYNKTGEYQKFNFSEGDAPTRLRVDWNGDTYPQGWVDDGGGEGLRLELSGGHANIVKFQIPNSRVTFTNEETEAVLSVQQVYELLESGEKVVLDHVPLGAYYPYASDDTIMAFSYTDNIELSNYVYDEGSEDVFTSYTGGAFAPVANANVHMYLGVQIRKQASNQEYSFFVGGRGHYYAN